MLAIVVALLIALLVKTFVVQPFYIPSGSMENTLLIGDKILVNKVVYKIRPISRGDVVVFSGAGSWNGPARKPARNRGLLVRLYDVTIGWLVSSVKGLAGLEHTSPHSDYIKRVIGIPGDHVACCTARGQITVNGVPLREKSYLVPGARPSRGSFSLVVPPGRLWVMGDNRPDSEDSRMHDCAYALADQCHPWDPDGTIAESRVVGRAFMVMWPPDRMRILPIPATFDQARLVHAVAGSSAALLPLAACLAVRPAGRLRRARLSRRRRRHGRLAGSATGGL